MTREQELKLAVGQAKQVVEYFEYALAFEQVGDRTLSVEWKLRGQSLANKLGGSMRIGVVE
jgi:hypothetical protein